MTHHIHSGFSRFILALLIMAGVYTGSPSLSMGATLLPNGEQVFLDNNGNPIAGGKVYFYTPNTEVAKNTCTTSACTALNTNPVVLNAAGRAVIYGNGCYRQVVKNSSETTTYWDKTTCDTSTGQNIWAGTATGTPNAIILNTSDFSGADGQVVRFVAAFINSGATTINPGSFGNISVVVDGGSGPVALTGGEIIAGNIVTVVYDANAGLFHLSTLTTLTAGAGLTTGGVGTTNGTLAVAGTLTSVRPVNSQTGTTYTLLSTDNAKLITLNNASAVAVTVPSAASAGFTAGYFADIINLNSGVVTLTPSSGTINGKTSLTVAYNRGGRLVSNGTNWFFNTGSPEPAGGATGFKNLNITNGGAADTEMAITASYLVTMDDSGNSIKLSSVSVTGALTTSGANGIDTGSRATNTWYSIWVIYNATSNTTAALYSTSATTPTLPAGYTYKVRVGWNRTDAVSSGNFYRVNQKNNKAQYVVTPATNTATLRLIAQGPAGTYHPASPTWATQSISNFVPPTASEIALVATVDYNNSTDSNVYVAPNTSYNGYQSTNPPPFSAFSTGGSNRFEFALESTNIAWLSSGTGGAILAMGWTDNL